MIDVVALGELLIDFAAKSADAAGYPTMAANPGGAESDLNIPQKPKRGIIKFSQAS